MSPTFWPKDKSKDKRYQAHIGAKTLLNIVKHC